MKKINFLLISFMVLFSCLSGSLDLATESTDSSGPFPNNVSLSEPALEAASLSSEFLEPDEPAPLDSILIYDSDYGHISGPGYIPAPVSLSELSRPSERLLLKASEQELPATYDLREQGNVTPVKNQGRSGSCWAFSSLASLESHTLRTEGVSRDFSENNMKNLVTKYYPEGFDYTADAGGNAFMAMAYLARWNGPVNESSDPFDEFSTYSPAGLPVQKYTREVFLLPERKGALDNEYIKRALMDYGAVYSTMYWNQAYYLEKNRTYHFRGTNIVNHAVTIVGWNDSFDRNMFSPAPPMDGAFIVRNSWGESWGEGGYFYISYNDTRLAYKENAVFTAESPENFDCIYLYDPLGWTTSIRFNEYLTAWGGNVFSSGGNEKLQAVGFYTTDLNTAYEVYIYKNPANGPLNSARNFVIRESGTCPLPGYHTHKLNSTVDLTPGEKFSVVMKFTNPSSPNPLAIEQPIDGYSSKAKANPGESYVSHDGASWQDLTLKSEFSKANLCIKAFTTVTTPPEADFSANITNWVSPLTVQFTDLSKSAFSWEWDFNGDGITDSIARNPVYTYTSYGSYNISLNISNRNGFDSEIKSNYITVVPLSLTSSNPGRDPTTYEGERQEFNISTNHNATVSWYLKGTKINTESNVNLSSYSNNSLSPGIYNVTAFASVGKETVARTWNWTILDWNPWDNSTSQEGKNITTRELQEAIHVYKNNLPIPGTGAELTDERLREIIRLWREDSVN